MKRLRRDGSALVMVLSMTAIGVILCSGIMTYAVNNARLAQREELIERALHVAEAGLEWAAQYIVDRDAYLFVNSTPIEGTINQGSFQGVIQKEGFRTYSISCTGTVQGVSRAVTIDEVYVATFAKFGWWSEVNGDIWFIPGDNLFGHVHTDDYLKFSTTSGAGPVFDGNLTSRKNRYTLRKNGYDRTEYTRPPAESAGVEFNAGFDLSSPQGNMADVNWSTKKTLASNPLYADGLYLEGYTEIEIIGNEIEVYNPRGEIDRERFPIRQEQLVYVANYSSRDRGTLILRGGELEGQMTIFTEDDIYLTDHLTYKNDPRDDHLPEHERDYPEESNDKLGLVTMDDIWVHPAAPNNLKIFAAMMATGAVSQYNDGSFAV